jgi:hypothetical protein
VPSPAPTSPRLNTIRPLNALGADEGVDEPGLPAEASSLLELHPTSRKAQHNAVTATLAFVPHITPPCRAHGGNASVRHGLSKPRTEPPHPAHRLGSPIVFKAYLDPGSTDHDRALARTSLRGIEDDTE